MVQKIKDFFTFKEDDRYINGEYDNEGYEGEYGNDWESGYNNQGANLDQTIAIPHARPNDYANGYANDAENFNYKLVKTTPKSIEDACFVCDILKENKTAVVNLQGLSTAEAQRIVDFISGIVKALDGKLDPATDRLYHVLPSVASISDEDKERLKSNGIFQSFKSSIQRVNQKI